MASDLFVASVAQEMQRILNSPDECSRLGLAPDIVRGWRRYFVQDSAEAMIEKIKTVARDNGIQLDNYEPHATSGAAEMILSTVDAFYRKTVAPRTLT